MSKEVGTGGRFDIFLVSGFCMEPFREGKDRLPVYAISWNRSVQNRSFQNIHTRTVPNDSLSLHLSGA